MNQPEIMTFGELEEGYLVKGPNGNWVEVSKSYEHHVPDSGTYELEFENGVKIEASGNHLFYVETENDILSHGLRVKEAKKILKDLTAEEISYLEEYAYNDSMVDFEIDLDYIGGLLDFASKPERMNLVLRCAQSIGPVAEDHYHQVDIATSELADTVTIPSYNATLLAQQILRLTGKRKYRKWKVVVGRVVTVEEIVHVYDQVDIPTIEEYRAR